MIGNLIDIFLCSLVVITEFVGVIILAALVQLVVYQTTGIDLYKKIVNSKILWK